MQAVDEPYWNVIVLKITRRDARNDDVNDALSNEPVAIDVISAEVIINE
jgi:hypothetical protein